jgi:hypothetical protein
MARKGLGKLTARIREFFPHHTMTQQKVHCPNYDCDATITTRTRLRAGHRARHVAVETCSLMPKQPAAAGAGVNWVPDIPYQNMALRAGEGPPHYTSGVPCPETCLKLVNGEVDLSPNRQRHCIMGMYDGLEIEREVNHKTITETMPFRAPEAFCG